MEVIVQIIWNIIALPIAFMVGWTTERNHHRRLDEREAICRGVKVTNLKRVTQPETVVGSTMVIGQVVIATDYWKSFVTKVRKLVGGELRAAQTLMIRARREALLRMIDKAREYGATEVWNVRFEFSNIWPPLFIPPHSVAPPGASVPRLIFQ